MSNQRKLLLIKKGFNLSVTSFTQSLGAELLTNGDFSAWTGDNPDGWTVSGESGADPEITQRASNQGHAGAGTGACNFFSSATSNQPRLTQSVVAAASWYEFSADITNYVVGGIRLTDGSLSGFTYQSTGTRKRVFLAQNTASQISSIGASCDITVDNASIKKITPNAVTPAVTDGTFDFTFSLPGTTYAGQLIGLMYRIQDASNFWMAYLLRNVNDTAWDIRLVRVVTNSFNEHTNATGVGSPTGIRVVVSGDTHQMYTLSGGVYTARGSLITNSAFNTAINMGTIYSPDATPIQLSVAA